MKVKIRTNAKINLYLRIVGGRPDGFHELETILHGVTLGDEIEIERTSTKDVDLSIRLGRDVSGRLPAAEDNLVMRVVKRLVERGAHPDGLAIRITKNIPIAAGLGGGSGNAAGVLAVLNEMLELGLGDDDLLELASSVGSDVPYCLKGGTTLALGRGEKLTKLPAPDDMWFVLGISDEPLSTEDVYREWDRLESDEAPSSALITMALGSEDVLEVARHLHNDLEAPAIRIRPELVEKKEALVAAGALGAALSGSGPTLFAIVLSEPEAKEMAASVRGVFDRVRVVSSQPTCIERL